VVESTFQSGLVGVYCVKVQANLKAEETEMIDANNLNDTQLVILTTASNNPGRSVLPYAKSMKTFGRALNYSLDSLMAKGLIVRDERTGLNEPSLKDERGRYTYRITKEGLKAINAEPEEESKMTSKYDTGKKEAKAETEEAKAAAKAAEAAAKAAEAEAEAEAKAAEAEAKAKAKAEAAAAKAAEAEAKAKAKAEEAEAKAKAKAEAAAAKAAAKAEAAEAEAEAKAEAKAARKAAGEAPRRGNSGKHLYPLVGKNPRRPGSFGHFSMQIILDEPGISYEEYIKKGGRSNDLNWDIDHGFTEARFPTAVAA
jgi:hypothetical protein